MNVSRYLLINTNKSFPLRSPSTFRKNAPNYQETNGFREKVSHPFSDTNFSRVTKSAPDSDELISNHTYDHEEVPIFRLINF